MRSVDRWFRALLPTSGRRTRIAADRPDRDRGGNSDGDRFRSGHRLAGPVDADVGISRSAPKDFTLLSTGRQVHGCRWGRSPIERPGGRSGAVLTAGSLENRLGCMCKARHRERLHSLRSMRRKRVLPVSAPMCGVLRQPHRMLVRSRRRTEEPQSLPRPAADAAGVHCAHHRCGLRAGRRITPPG